MSGFLTKTFKIVRHVGVSNKQLMQIAEILGIPESERSGVISGEVHIVASSPSPKGAAKKKAKKG